MTRITLRDLFWLTLSIALCAGWWVREGQLATAYEQMKERFENAQANVVILQENYGALLEKFEEGGSYSYTFEESSPGVWTTKTIVSPRARESVDP